MIQTVDQINDVNRHESELAAANQLIVSWALFALPVAAFFAAGEEIIWGQRILSWEIPAMYRYELF